MVKKIWELAGSVQVVIPLLIIITLVSLAGVLVPQDLPAAAYQQGMGGLRTAIVLHLGLNHVFSTWWFFSLLGLLAISIVVCSVSNQWKNLKNATGQHLLAGPDTVATLKCSTSFTAYGDPGPIAAAAAGYFRRRFFFCAQQKKDNNIQIAARSPGIKEAGSIIFHSSILFFFAGGIVGLSGGFSYVNELRKGDVVPVRESPFLVRCDWFKVEKNNEGGISAYKSKLTILAGDLTPLVEKIIGVNHPLSYKGISFYQNSYGEQHDGFDEAILRVSGPGLDSSGYIGSFPLGSSIELPGGMTLTIRRFVCDFIIDMNTREVLSRSDKPNNPAVEVELVKGHDVCYNTWAFARFPDMHENSRDGCKVEFLSYTPRYYTGIKISKNPGTPLIWLGFTLMTVGIFLVFYFPHKSFWIFVEPRGNHTARIVFGGTSGLPLSSFKGDFDRKSASLQRVLKEGTTS
jgi:cytochrome c biogenesis protein